MSTIIKSLYIRGFKGFKNEFKVNFNIGKNILVGNNGVGKSTILQAIDLVMQCKGVSTFGNGNLGYANYINLDLVRETQEKFVKYSASGFTYDMLPVMWICVVIQSDEEQLLEFNGTNYPEEFSDKKQKMREGVVFQYRFNEEFADEFEDYIKNIKSSSEFEIPFEFYTASWNTLSGKTYISSRDPMKTILIDNDAFKGNPFNVFAQELYSNMEKINQIDSRISFRKQNERVKFNLPLNKNVTDYQLLVNANILNLINLIDVKEKSSGIYIRDLGSGQENLIKTKLSLDYKSNLILIEEPENHLTAEKTREQIEEINQLSNNKKQMIITTHNPQIVTRLGIKNLMWLKKKDDIISSVSMNNLDPKAQSFFDRRDDIDFLRILTAKKVILVEGATEYILMRSFLKKAGYEEKIINNIEILSMVGRAYESFVNLARITNNKLLIFTDNDGEKSRLNKIKKYKFKNDMNPEIRTRISGFLLWLNYLSKIK